MGWVVRMLAGPMLWAVLFAAVYALHGTGCALGWPAVATPFGPVHRVVMVALWLAGLGLHVALLATAPEGKGRERFLIRAGAWIGLVSSGISLAPVVLVSTCGAG